MTKTEIRYNNHGRIANESSSTRGDGPLGIIWKVLAMDTLTPKQRSERMSRVRNKDTKPELCVRHLAHSLGYRYRLHAAHLPGKPDLVFASRRKVIFVHGCFWHRHERCILCRMPKSRLEFWKPKLKANRNRDLVNQERLSQLGWRYMIVWECELRDLEELARRIKKFLGGKLT